MLWTTALHIILYIQQNHLLPQSDLNNTHEEPPILSHFRSVCKDNIKSHLTIKCLL